MISILAQAEPTTALQIPVSYAGIAGIVFGGVVVFGLIAVYMLQQFQAGRAALVAEVKKELATPVEPQAMTLPQPFTVQPHVIPATADDFKAVAAALEKHITSTDQKFVTMTANASAGREKVYNLIREENRLTRADVSAQVTGVQSTINDTLVALGRVEGELRAYRGQTKA